MDTQKLAQHWRHYWQTDRTERFGQFVMNREGWITDPAGNLFNEADPDRAYGILAQIIGD